MYDINYFSSSDGKSLANQIDSWLKSSPDRVIHSVTTVSKFNVIILSRVVNRSTPTLSGIGHEGPVPVAPEDDYDHLCPLCDTPMQVRKRRKDNGLFWGCPNYNVNGCKGSMSWQDEDYDICTTPGQRYTTSSYKEEPF
jgi:hypothetical protein